MIVRMSAKENLNPLSAEAETYHFDSDPVLAG